MIHTSITIPPEIREDEQAVADLIAYKLTHGARLAIKKLRGDCWLTAKEGGFSSNGARFLWWQYQDLNLCELKQVQYKTTTAREYNSYRLTPRGVLVRNAVLMQAR